MPPYMMSDIFHMFARGKFERTLQGHQQIWALLEPNQAPGVKDKCSLDIPKTNTSQTKKWLIENVKKPSTSDKSVAFKIFPNTTKIALIQGWENGRIKHACLFCQEIDCQKSLQDWSTFLNWWCIRSNSMGPRTKCSWTCDSTSRMRF
jgi:hypothetical protein